MRRILRITLIVLVVFLIAAAVTVFVLDRMRRHVPDFYEQALEVEPAKQAVSGKTLEQQARDLVIKGVIGINDFKNVERR